MEHSPDDSQEDSKAVPANSGSTANPQANLPPSISPAALQDVILARPVDGEYDEPDKRGSYAAALLLTGSIVPLPISAAMMTAAIYITHPNWTTVIGPVTLSTNLLVILVSLGITLLLWLLASPLFRLFTIFDNANPQSSSHLKRHLLALRTLKDTLDPSSQTFAKDSSLVSLRNKNPQDYDLALKSVFDYLAAANKQLEGKGISWIMGIGYLKAWNFVHRAEEALLDIAPREFVIREALHDESAIDGSNIASTNYLLSNLRTAVKALSPSAVAYLKSYPVQDRTTPPANADSSNQPDQEKPPVPPDLLAPPDPVVEIEARNALRDARQTLNEFRANLWDGLVRVRNLLLGTALITGLLTYVLLCVTISAYVPGELESVRVESIKAATIFYLVGAIIGLFSRLYTESQSDGAIDDYGLTVTRIVIIPILSGLAAVAGVLVVAILSLNLLHAPGVNIVVNANNTTTAFPRLQDVYNLVQNQQGIVLAALFGLTPNLLINILQQKADDAKTQLKNSSAPNQGKS